MARRCRAKIVLLSVVPHSGGLQMAEGIYVGAIAAQLERHKDLLKQAVAWLRERGFDPVAEIVVGEPAPMIGQVAKAVAADLVVVGHQKRSFLARWWSGETNAYLSDNIGCSLLVARNPMSDEAFEEELGRLESA